MLAALSQVLKYDVYRDDAARHGEVAAAPKPLDFNIAPSGAVTPSLSCARTAP